MQGLGEDIPCQYQAKITNNCLLSTPILLNIPVQQNIPLPITHLLNTSKPLKEKDETELVLFVINAVYLLITQVQKQIS